MLEPRTVEVHWEGNADHSTSSMAPTPSRIRPPPTASRRPIHRQSGVSSVILSRQASALVRRTRRMAPAELIARPPAKARSSIFRHYRIKLTSGLIQTGPFAFERFISEVGEGLDSPPQGRSDRSKVGFVETVWSAMLSVSARRAIFCNSRRIVGGDIDRLSREQSRLEPVADVELLEDARHVMFDRLVA